MLFQSIFTKIRPTQIIRCKHVLGNYVFLQVSENVSDIVFEQNSSNVIKPIREPYRKQPINIH